MADVRVQYARSKGASIAYQTVGTGSVDLLVMSGYAYPIDAIDEEPSYARVDRRLASFSRLLRFDMRGCGLSDPVDPSTPPTIEEWAQDALAVLDAAGSRKATILSGWAIIAPAIVLAVNNPDRVQSLVLVNAAARFLRADDYPAGVPERLFARLAEVTLLPDAVERGFDALAVRAPSVADDPTFRAWHDRAGNRGASPATARLLGDVFNHADVRSLLPNITVPTLVIHRRDNQWTRVAHGRYLAEHIPGATYLELPGADDLWWVGDSNAILDEVEEFMTGARPAPQGDVTLAAVLFTDIVASTEQSSRLGHRRWTAMTDAHDSMVRAKLARYRGREIKNLGDGFLAVFDSVTRAVHAATEITSEARHMSLSVRAGVHTGEIEIRPDDVIGLAVSIAKRICDSGDAHEVMISDTVRSQLIGSGIPTAPRGNSHPQRSPGTLAPVRHRSPGLKGTCDGRDSGGIGMSEAVEVVKRMLSVSVGVAAMPAVACRDAGRAW